MFGPTEFIQPNGMKTVWLPEGNDLKHMKTSKFLTLNLS